MIDDTLYDAFGQRQVTQYFTQTQLATTSCSRCCPSCRATSTRCDKIYVNRRHRPAGAAVDAGQLDTDAGDLLSINHQGQFPAVTLSFNLAPGVALGQAVDAIQHGRAEIGMPASLIGSFQGTRRPSRIRSSSQPLPDRSPR